MTGPRLRGVRWALLDQGLVSGVNFLTGVLLARLLGVEGYGVFSLAWMAVLFLNGIQTALIISPMMSIGAKEEGGAPEYFAAVLLQQAVLAGISFVLVLLGARLSIAWFPEWRIASLGLPLALCSAGFQLQDFVRRYFFTVERMVAAFANDVVSYMGQLLGLVVLASVGLLDAAGALWVIAGTSLLAALVGLAGFGRLCLRLATTREVARRHWRFSRWLVASALMQWTSWNFFVVAGATQLGPLAAGAMRATQNIIGVTHILFQGLANVVPVQAAKALHQGGAHRLRRYLVRVAAWGGGATAGLCLIAGVGAEFWLQLFYGTEYLDYAFVLRWWAASYLLIFFGVPLTSGLRALENTRPMFVAYCVITVFSLALAVPAVKLLGLHGAMAGMLVSQLLLQGILASSLRRRLLGH